MPTPETPQPAFRPEIPRRATDIPGVVRPAAAAPAPAAASPGSGASTGTSAAARHEGAEPKTLIVGRDITLNGQIASCDRLVIEGKVEASLSECQNIEIADSGLFKGTAEVQEADIRGRFEGTLTVRGRLMIRAAGRVAGEVRYGQLEIECGGQLTGTVETSAKEVGKHGGSAV